MDLLTLYTLRLTETELKVLSRIIEIADEKGVNQYVIWDLSDGPAIEENGSGLTPLFDSKDLNQQAALVLGSFAQHGLIGWLYLSGQRNQLTITGAARKLLKFEKLSQTEQQRTITRLLRKANRPNRQGTIAFWLSITSMAISIILNLQQILEVFGIISPGK